MSPSLDRIAVMFRSGVTVSQAQRLLLSANARPLRLIPGKHGFLVKLPSVSEATIAQQLRQHPYVREVLCLDVQSGRSSESES